MFTILWLLFVAFIIATPLVWILDHNGMVVVNWLGYSIQTDILTAILSAVFFTIIIFIISYFVARILAIKFPNLLRTFFKKRYYKRLEKVIHRHHHAFNLLTKMVLALEVGDNKSGENFRKEFSRLVKNRHLNNFFLGKISFESKQFSKAAELFVQLGENRHAKILVLKSKFNVALQSDDEVSAIAYAQQILAVKNDDVDSAKILFALYKKRGLWQDAKNLIARYGADKFRDELQSRDVAVINAALALEAYQQKKFFLAIKHAKITLRAEPNFLPATEIALKSWIKLGLSFKVVWKIKSLWRENPHLILAEIFDLVNRKSSAKNRIKAVKKLASINKESPLSRLAIGLVAFRCGNFDYAKDALRLALQQEKTYRAYKLLAFTEKALGNNEGFKTNIMKADLLSKDDHYLCTSCHQLSSKWNAKCSHCGSYDSLEWGS